MKTTVSINQITTILQELTIQNVCLKEYAMKTKKAVQIYSLTVPASTQQKSFSLFDSPSTQTLYFPAKEEAQLYQGKYYPTVSLDKTVHVAVQDKDKQGNDRWVLIRKTEDMRNSEHNQKLDRSDYYKHSLYFSAAPSLEKAIAENPDSVFVVRKSDETRWSDEGQMGGPSSTTIIYDCSDIVDKDTRFLYVSGHERWFVERGEDLTITSALDLKLENDMQINQQRIDELLDEQERLTQQQRRLGASKRF